MTIMTDTQTRAEKIAEMSEPQLIRLHSKNMREIEAVIDEAIRRLDARQSEQRTGQAAQDLAELRALKCDLDGISQPNGRFCRAPEQCASRALW
jgi:hypothetical protein